MTLINLIVSAAEIRSQVLLRHGDVDGWDLLHRFRISRVFSAWIEVCGLCGLHQDRSRDGKRSGHHQYFHLFGDGIPKFCWHDFRESIPSFMSECQRVFFFAEFHSNRYEFGSAAGSTGGRGHLPSRRVLPSFRLHGGHASWNGIAEHLPSPGNCK